MQKSLVPKGREFIDFSQHKRTLEERLDSIKIEPEVAAAEAMKTGKKLLKDKVAGLFSITDLINTFYKFNEETDKAIKGIKRDKLLESFFDLSESNQETVSQLTAFLTNPSGNVLFNKIIRIVDENLPDIDLVNHLSMALYKIVNSEFESLFSEHKHALSQIERLTPQALTILSDSANWPMFYLSSSETMGNLVTSDWVDEFSEAYARNKGITDPSICLRISHSILELHNLGFVEARETQAGGSFSCVYTPIGKEIRRYIQR